ncbi:MAG TPA: hypothetical protein DDE71_06725 [Tenacibaculum sp.]|nr:hypothetical protein [Tenacibaculum sp.]
MSYNKMMKHCKAMQKNKRKGRNQHLGFDSFSSSNFEPVYTTNVTNDFEKWFFETYGKEHTLVQREDNYQTKENINYRLIKYKNQDYMVGSFSKGYTPYNKVN